MRSLALAALSTLAVGCTHYTPIAVHTVQAGPDRQTDVVWLIDETGDGPRVVRCVGGPEGPICAAAAPAKAP